MMTMTLVAVVLVVALVLLLLLHFCMKRVQVGASAVTVQRRPGAQQVAERLKALQDALVKFLEGADDPLAVKILARWDGQLSERSPAVGRQVAYTINKRSVSICVRDADRPDRLTDWNTSVFVALHELAHVGTDERGHTPLFDRNNMKLEVMAERAGVLQIRHYDAQPTTFCGLQIRHNPASCYYRGTCGSPWA